MHVGKSDELILQRIDHVTKAAHLPQCKITVRVSDGKMGINTFQDQIRGIPGGMVSTNSSAWSSLTPKRPIPGVYLNMHRKLEASLHGRSLVLTHGPFPKHKRLALIYTRQCLWLLTLRWIQTIKSFV